MSTDMNLNQIRGDKSRAPGTNHPGTPLTGVGEPMVMYGIPPVESEGRRPTIVKILRIFIAVYSKFWQCRYLIAYPQH